MRDETAGTGSASFDDFDLDSFLKENNFLDSGNPKDDAADAKTTIKRPRRHTPSERILPDESPRSEAPKHSLPEPTSEPKDVPQVKDTAPSGSSAPTPAPAPTATEAPKEASPATATPTAPTPAKASAPSPTPEEANASTATPIPALAPTPKQESERGSRGSTARARRTEKADPNATMTYEALGEDYPEIPLVEADTPHARSSRRAASPAAIAAANSLAAGGAAAGNRTTRKTRAARAAAAGAAGAAAAGVAGMAGAGVASAAGARAAGMAAAPGAAAAAAGTAAAAAGAASPRSTRATRSRTTTAPTPRKAASSSTPSELPATGRRPARSRNALADVASSIAPEVEEPLANVTPTKKTTTAQTSAATYRPNPAAIPTIEPIATPTTPAAETTPTAPAAKPQKSPKSAAARKAAAARKRTARLGSLANPSDFHQASLADNTYHIRGGGTRHNRRTPLMVTFIAVVLLVGVGLLAFLFMGPLQGLLGDKPKPDIVTLTSTQTREAIDSEMPKLIDYLAYSTDDAYALFAEAGWNVTPSERITAEDTGESTIGGEIIHLAPSVDPTILNQGYYEGGFDAYDFDELQRSFNGGWMLALSQGAEGASSQLKYLNFAATSLKDEMSHLRTLQGLDGELSAVDKEDVDGFGNTYIQGYTVVGETTYFWKIIGIAFGEYYHGQDRRSLPETAVFVKCTVANFDFYGAGTFPETETETEGEAGAEGETPTDTTEEATEEDPT